MNTPYSRPTFLQRLKITAHYLLPQFLITRAAGWLAERKWGFFSHTLIALFAKCYRINWNEADKGSPSDYDSFNEFFIRRLKDDARPIIDGNNTLCLPADGKVSESGTIQNGLLLQAKGHYFSLSDLLADDEALTAKMTGGSFLTTYLSPRDYHRVHMPCSGTLRKMVYVPGELFSVNPFLAEHIPNLFSRNERVICVFDTPFGTMVQILVGATVTASMSTVWAGVINPPRSQNIQVWDYPAEGMSAIRLEKGEEMGAFRLGSTVINVFEANAITLDARLQAGCVTRMGELLGTAG